MMNNRLAKLKQAFNAVANDDARYAFGQRLRDLGYLNLADFVAAKPPVEHLLAMERLAGLS